MHCPNCGGSDVRESLKHGIRDGILEMFGFVAYRCRACRSRFHRRPPSADAEEELEEVEGVESPPEPAPDREPDNSPR